MCFRPASISADIECPKCGAKNPITATQCSSCGATEEEIRAAMGPGGAPGAPPLPGAPGAPGAPGRPGIPKPPGAPGASKAPGAPKAPGQ
jgi:hypothetical protein